MTKRRAYFLGILFTLALCGIGTLAYQTPAIRKILPATITQPGFYKVVEAVDGDTFSVDMGSGTTEKVRLIGVDTPETHKPNTPVQCFGPEASAYTASQVAGKSVRLEADPTNSNRDRYGRLLRYVYLEDGTLLDQKLIELGYGFAYLSFPFQKADAFAASQATAQQQRLGLWAICQPTEKDGRWQSNNP